MWMILQRVSRASVRVAGRSVAEIGPGILALVGIERSDDRSLVEPAALKLAQLRIFPDDDGRMNHSLLDTGGACLVVSQFTLAASVDRGRRPSFDAAAPAAQAEPLVEELAEHLSRLGVEVATGCFGDQMEVELVNEGPVTFVLEVGAR